MRKPHFADNYIFVDTTCIIIPLFQGSIIHGINSARNHACFVLNKNPKPTILRAMLLKSICIYIYINNLWPVRSYGIHKYAGR